MREWMRKLQGVCERSEREIERGIECCYAGARTGSPRVCMRTMCALHEREEGTNTQTYTHTHTHIHTYKKNSRVLLHAGADLGIGEHINMCELAEIDA